MLGGKAKTEYQREYMRKRRSKYGSNMDYKRRSGVCEVCGFTDTVDLHHDGPDRVEHILCPNCHAMITRGLKTLLDLTEDPVRPEQQSHSPIMVGYVPPVGD